MPSQKTPTSRTILKSITDAEWAAMKTPYVGTIGPNIADDSLYWFTGLRKARLVDRDVLPDLWDIVDGRLVTELPEVYQTLEGARVGNSESVFIRDMSYDNATVTIVSGDDLQWIRSRLPDTVFTSQDIIINKDDFIIENIGLDASDIKMNADRAAAHDLLIKNTGTVTFGNSGSLNALYLSRIIGTTNTPVLVNAGASGVLIERVFFLTGTGDSSISFGGATNQIEIARCIFAQTVTTMLATSIIGTGLTNSALKGNQVIAAATSVGFNIYGSGNTLEDNTYIGSNGGAARQLRLNSGIGVSIDTRVISQNFIASDGSHILFECISADADGGGLVFALNVAPNGGTFRGHQDMMWLGNNLRANGTGTTVDFMSKPGQIVIGGDMTGTTLDNIPGDLVMIGVKGQPNRGNIRHAAGKIAMDDNVKFLFGTGEDASIYYDGTNLIIDPAGVGSGHVRLKSDLKPFTHAAFDLATTAARWRDLWLSRNAVIGGQLTVSGQTRLQGAGNEISGHTNSGLISVLFDNLYDLGTTTKRFKTGYFRTNVRVDGSVFVDTISEHDSGLGVTVDGLLIKDSLIPASGVPDTHGVTPSAHHPQTHPVTDHSGTPGGELDGTHASPTVDAVHSGSAHHAAIGDLDDVPYTPAVAGDWDAGDPGSSKDAVDELAERVKDLEVGEEIFYPIQHLDSSQATVDGFAAQVMDSTEKTRITGHVPFDFVSIVSVNMRIQPDATETLDQDFQITATALGENTTGTMVSNAGETKSVTVNQLTDWDITSLMPALAAGDSLGFRIDSNTSTIRILYIRFTYEKHP